ncbi:unnamed protein product, partial [Meganyctiphanes norvegica]
MHRLRIISSTCFLMIVLFYWSYTSPAIVIYNESLSKSNEVPDDSLSKSNEVTVDKQISNLEVPYEELMKGPYTLSQDDPYLIEYAQHKLSPPSQDPYKLSNPKIEDPSKGQSAEIRKILGEMKNGFFVECGALDGERISNTLGFERIYGWTGLLVEANPKNYDLVIQKKRKAWSIHACLSVKPYPNQIMFPKNVASCCGSISDIALDSKLEGYVKCL